MFTCSWWVSVYPSAFVLLMNQIDKLLTNLWKNPNINQFSSSFCFFLYQISSFIFSVNWDFLPIAGGYLFPSETRWSKLFVLFLFKEPYPFLNKLSYKPNILVVETVPSIHANDRIPALLFRLKVNIVCFKGPTQVTFVINDLDVHIYWKSPGKAYWGIDDKKVKSRWRLINYLWTVQQQKQTCYTRIWPEFSKWDCCFFIVGCITYFFSNPVIIVHEVEKWHNPLRKYSVTWTFFHVNSLSCFRMKSVFIFQVWNALNALCGNLHYMMIYQRYMMILQQCMLIHCLYILFL